jgi:hypothetical protein
MPLTNGQSRCISGTIFFLTPGAGFISRCKNERSPNRCRNAGPACLSGYAGAEFKSCKDFDWKLLHEATLRVMNESWNQNQKRMRGISVERPAAKKAFFRSESSSIRSCRSLPLCSPNEDRALDTEFCRHAIDCHFLARYLSPLSRCSSKDSLEASDVIELSSLCDTERSRALTRFEIIRPFLEDGVPLTRLAKEQQTVLRTARRWVERYRKSGLARLVRKERNDKDERRLLPELQEIIEGLALSRPKRSRTC